MNSLPFNLILYSYFCCHPRLPLHVVPVFHLFFICCLWYVFSTYFCCHFWAGAPSCYLEMLDKLQKCMRSTVTPSLLVLCLIAETLLKYSQRKLLFIGVTVIDVYLNWLNWFHSLILKGSMLVILIDCTNFLLPDVCVSSFFLCTASSGILCL